eukprot:scaffold4224_cov43-Tisochrysis_lutea.AAC.3
MEVMRRRMAPGGKTARPYEMAATAAYEPSAASLDEGGFTIENRRVGRIGGGSAAIDGGSHCRGRARGEESGGAASRRAGGHKAREGV